MAACFTADAAHEWRTPLAGIRRQAQVAVARSAVLGGLEVTVEWPAAG